MDNTICTPPAVNGDLLRVAPSGKPGQGACIPKKSNLDGLVNHVDPGWGHVVKRSGFFVSLLVKLFRKREVLEFSVFQELGDTRTLRLCMTRDAQSHVTVQVFHPNGDDWFPVVTPRKLVDALNQFFLVWQGGRVVVRYKVHGPTPFGVRHIIRRFVLSLNRGVAA